MSTRRHFLQMSAAAATASALIPRRAGAEEAAKVHQAWVLSDIHCGHSEDGKDGAGWLEAACSDLKNAGIPIHRAMTLGDISHDGTAEQFQAYLKIRASSGITRWHEIAGNHEYHPKDGANAFHQLIGKTEPYSIIDGNIAWIFLSDEVRGVEGNLSEQSCAWLEAELAKHADKNVIVCSHQLVKDTVAGSNQKARQLHPTDRIAGIIAKSRVDLWLCGHEHHGPYTSKHLIRKDQTTYINVASMNHAYGTGGSHSSIIECRNGASELIVRRRNHDHQRFLEAFETRVPLRHAIECA